MVYPSTIITLLAGLVSAYALTESAQSIPKLQKYERKAEKAAEWSVAAEKRLWNTRYTVGAGFVAAAFSLLSAVIFLLFVPTKTGMPSVIWCLCLVAGQAGTARYMRSFWADKAKIPLMDEYNDAITGTVNVIDFLNVLASCWGVVGF